MQDCGEKRNSCLNGILYIWMWIALLLVRRGTWHTENNRPVILDELKTKAAHQNIPLPVCLADCLKETKLIHSQNVVPNRDGDPLSLYTVQAALAVHCGRQSRRFIIATRMESV